LGSINVEVVIWHHLPARLRTSSDPLVQKNHHHGVDISEPGLTGFSEAHAIQLQGHPSVVDFEAEREHPTFQQLSPDLRNYWTEQEARISDLVKKPVTSCHKGRNLRSLQMCLNRNYSMPTIRSISREPCAGGKLLPSQSRYTRTYALSLLTTFPMILPWMEPTCHPYPSEEQAAQTPWKLLSEIFPVSSLWIHVRSVKARRASRWERRQQGLNGPLMEQKMQCTYFTGTTADGNRSPVDSTSFKSMHYQASRDFKAEIPLSSFKWDKYSTVTPAVEFDTASNTCSEQVKQEIQLGSLHINRTIYSHSGVTDMKIEPISSLDDRHILRMELPVENGEGAPNMFTRQSSHTTQVLCLRSPSKTSTRN
jgi:hypothetical protein